MRENPVFSRVLRSFVQKKAVKKLREKLVGPNTSIASIKALGYPTEICDFVLGDGSYYSLFSRLDTSKNCVELWGKTT